MSNSILICLFSQEDVADVLWSQVSDPDKYDAICGVPYTALPLATVSLP